MTGLPQIRGRGCIYPEIQWWSNGLCPAASNPGPTTGCCVGRLGELLPVGVESFMEHRFEIQNLESASGCPAVWPAVVSYLYLSGEQTILASAPTTGSRGCHLCKRWRQRLKPKQPEPLPLSGEGAWDACGNCLPASYPWRVTKKSFRNSGYDGHLIKNIEANNMCFTVM